MSDQDSLRKKLVAIRWDCYEQRVPEFVIDQFILPILQAELRTQRKRMYPIQDGARVPWEVMAPHEAQAQKNHGQSLEHLADRGGLGAGEAWLIVNDLPLSDKRDGKHYEWDWRELKAKWQAFTERINLHYEELEQTRKTLAARDETIRRLREAMDHVIVTYGLGIKACWFEDLVERVNALEKRVIAQGDK